MDATIKAQWLEALRSGKYKQGKGALHNKSDDSYCCLGVLCEVMGVPEFHGDGDRESSEFINFGTIDDFSSTSLPYQVRRVAGLLDGYGCFAGPMGEDESLAHMNDTGASFEEIAKIIEEKF